VRFFSQTIHSILRGCGFFSNLEELLAKRVITFEQYNEARKVQAEAEIKKAEIKKAEIKKANPKNQIKKSRSRNRSKKLQACKSSN
jgi:hypothetical protein